ncbi:MAG TPA: AsmA family protein [Burkholderiales bacterium]
MRVLKWLGGAVLVLFVVIALFFTFGLNALKRPIANAVTKATGRELLIEGDLKPVWSWVHPRIRAEGVSFANAEWGQADYLLIADAVEASLSVLPLFAGRVVLPEVHLEGAELSLEQDAEGRKNWILKEDEQKDESRFYVKRLTLDEALLRWEDEVREHSFAVDLSTDDTGVQFTAEGTYGGMPMKASGHAGQVLSIRDPDTPFPIEGEIRIGATSAKLEGTITGMIGFKGIDLRFDKLAGKSMDELYDIIGLAFPATSPYTVSGRLYRNDGTWIFEDFAGKVGESDLAGSIRVETAEGKRPFMKGEITAKTLNFADLGALVGTQQSSAKRSGVLPDMPFAPERWESVDADVSITAGTIKRPEQLPIDRLVTHIRMRDRVLSLEPLEFGIAGGRLAGTVRMDGNQEPMRGDIRMRVQKLQLAQMFPTIKQAQGSIGDLNGLIELAGTGDSVGKLLGSSNGKIGVYMDEGKISRFLMELVALDLWNAARVKLKGDEQIDIRCAIADFGVKGGVMSTNALVFDTAVVNVQGGGIVNLKSEEMDIKLEPKPKDGSIASLRSPLYIRGTFGQPDIGPDMGRVTAKGAGAILLGILNPLLAVLPLMEEGKGKDSPCGQLIAQATKSTKQAAKQPAGKQAATASSTSSGRSAASGETARRPPSRPEN